VVKLWPARQLETEQGTVRQGLKMLTHHFLKNAQQGAEFKIELGEDSRFWPCDEALARLAQAGKTAKPGPVSQIIYD
jgi:DNA polymerase III subunit alpha